MKLRVVLYCLLAGFPLTLASIGAGHFAWWWLEGIVLGAAFAPIAMFGPRSILGQFAVVWPTLAIVGGLCTWSEAYLFLPGATHPSDLKQILFFWTVATVGYAVFPRLLKLSHPSEIIPEHRSLAGSTGMVALSGVAYVIFYLIFGSITYFFFTRKYYPEGVHQAQQLGIWLWVIQFSRGVLMTLAVVPAIYTLKMKRWQVAVTMGIVIWVAGGLAPLIVPNAAMGAAQRMIHIVEIFTQNASLGVVAGLLLRPRAGRRMASHAMVSAASS
jgi:hypothetical protein